MPQSRLQKKVQNLIDLNGQDIDLVGLDIISEIEAMEETEDGYKDKIRVLEEEVANLNSTIENHKEEKRNSSLKINTGLDIISISLERGNLQDQQVIDALSMCYERGIKPLDIVFSLESILKNN